MIIHVKEALIQFNHAVPLRHQDQPYPQIKPKYNQKVQYTKEEDSSPLMTAAKKKLIQEVLGLFLYYSHINDSTILTVIGSIDTHQAHPTENTMRNIQELLDYAATHPDAIINASYLL